MGGVRPDAVADSVFAHVAGNPYARCGAKREIWQLLADLAGRGAAIVMVSSELPEILALSDRILVMREGRVTAELDREAATEEKIMYHATHGGGR